MDPVVLVGTQVDGLCILDVRRSVDGIPQAASFSLKKLGLSAATWAHELGDFGRFLALLESIDRDWRGWAGTRQWADLEGSVTITAVHTGSHVRFTVELRHGVSWTARTDIDVGAGEDITNALQAARSVFG